MGSACSHSTASVPGKFHGPAADSALGERLLDVLPVAAAAGFALDLSHTIALCGATWRPRSSQSVLRCALRRQAPWLAAARRVPRAQGRGGCTTQLMRTAADGRERRVRELVAGGAALGSVDCLQGWNALHWACEQADERVAAALLLGHGGAALLDARDRAGRTPLMRASWHGHERVVRLLIENGARPELQDDEGASALQLAATSGHAATADLLLRAAPGTAAAAALLRLRSRRGLTPLGATLQRGRGAVAALLRAYGAAA